MLSPVLFTACGGSGNSAVSCSPKPNISSSPPARAIAGTEYGYYVSASKMCLIAVCSPRIEGLRLPVEAKIDYDTITWTPSLSQVGSAVSFKIATESDICGERATQSWKVHVDAPEESEDEVIYPEGEGSWRLIAAENAPESHYGFSSVWTGTEMIIWGGSDPSSGFRYNPETDKWTAISSVNAPSPRRNHSAIWTGTEMIVWGGQVLPYYPYQWLSDGGRYDPITDTWHSMTSSGAPEGRAEHVAVWTGSQMLIWGGRAGGSNNTYPQTGGIYNPDTNSWENLSGKNIASGHSYHTAVWSGTEMLVWGGYSKGYRYNPVTDSWSATNTQDAPSPRKSHTAIWTGTEMIIWGGYRDGLETEYLNSGSRYYPLTDSWLPTAQPDISPRWGHSAVWTGSKMIVWGGYSGVGGTLVGGIYDPVTDSWEYTTTENAPVNRDSHTAFWTGETMLIWGGVNGTRVSTGGIYTPSG